jgi:hypothetical protein
LSLALKGNNHGVRKLKQTGDKCFYWDKISLSRKRCKNNIIGIGRNKKIIISGAILEHFQSFVPTPFIEPEQTKTRRKSFVSASNQSRSAVKSKAITQMLLQSLVQAAEAAGEFKLMSSSIQSITVTCGSTTHVLLN